MDFYSKGTIKIKNADGVLVPFLPTTDFSCVSNQSNKTLPQIISNMEAEIVEAENSGGIELMYEEPTEENTASFNEETMIAVLEQEAWTFTVDTTKLSPENTYTGVPFNYHGISGTAYNTGFKDPNPISITVDWGDGTKSNITVTDLSSSTNNSTTEAVVHSYENPGVYNVKVGSNDWERIYISTGTGYAYNIELHDTTRNIYYFVKTLTRLTSSIPKIKGTVKPNYWDNYTNVRYWTRTDNTFYGFFCGCSALTYISEKLFAKNSDVTSFSRCFAECSVIENLPERLFNPCINVEIFSDCFYKCASLRHIPERLFKRNTAATSFSDCFCYCDALEAIPEGLFAYNASVSSFSSCFEYCKALQSIPKRLFYHNLEAINFRDCFYYCTSLATIPSGLFDKNVAATTFRGCFQYCSKIKAIPEHLFDNNAAVTSFHQCFAYSSVESIPTDIFKNNPAVTDFGGCFTNCKITSIPDDLFRYNPAVIAFGSCFAGCTGLTSIPENLFRYNINVGVGTESGSGTRLEHFNACFSGCTGLTSIPENLFRYNGSVGSFWETFSGCSQLGTFTLYITSSGVSTASSFVPKKTGVARTIHVPAGSTTKRSFDNVASTLGLTIIGD